MSGRAATRRAEQIDNLSAPGAQRLSEMIRAFWSAAGFDNIRTEIVHSGGSAKAPAYGVRSNLIGGLPAVTTKPGGSPTSPACACRLDRAA
jgi:hypothetical protein